MQDRERGHENGMQLKKGRGFQRRERWGERGKRHEEVRGTQRDEERVESE